ncbi:MAG: hypothetical protein PF689_13750 [Deltaproteobacteria bacterium]|jgi:hypothetical protein|nr:hypothetical protein [Deltaproteobacteria bacterium]
MTKDKFSFNSIPRILHNKLKSDFLAAALVLLVSGLLFMLILKILITVFPAG